MNLLKELNDCFPEWLEQHEVVLKVQKIQRRICWSEYSQRETGLQTVCLHLSLFSFPQASTCKPRIFPATAATPTPLSPEGYNLMNSFEVLSRPCRPSGCGNVRPHSQADAVAPARPCVCSSSEVRYHAVTELQARVSADTTTPDVPTNQPLTRKRPKEKPFLPTLSILLTFRCEAKELLFFLKKVYKV